MYYRNSITPQQSMQARTEDWGARWNRDTVSRHILLQEMQSQRQEARDWSAESVLHTLSSMKANRARGVDSWTPGEMLRLPKRAIAGLANVMQAVEESLALPTQICVNVVALQGKPNGAGERPVTLTGCLYAIFMAGHQKEARLWDDAYHGWWDDAVTGNCALQSGLRGRIYQKVATLNGQPSACLFFDVEKFLRPCVCTISSDWHWIGISPCGCST